MYFFYEKEQQERQYIVQIKNFLQNISKSSTLSSPIKKIVINMITLQNTNAIVVHMRENQIEDSNMGRKDSFSNIFLYS